MADDSTVDQDKFDAVLKRLIQAKPQTEAETRAKAIEIRKDRHAEAERQGKRKETGYKD